MKKSDKKDRNANKYDDVSSHYNTLFCCLLSSIEIFLTDSGTIESEPLSGNFRRWTRLHLCPRLEPVIPQSDRRREKQSFKCIHYWQTVEAERPDPWGDCPNEAETEDAEKQGLRGQLPDQAHRAEGRAGAGESRRDVRDWEASGGQRKDQGRDRSSPSQVWSPAKIRHTEKNPPACRNGTVNTSWFAIFQPHYDVMLLFKWSERYEWYSVVVLQQ